MGWKQGRTKEERLHWSDIRACAIAASGGRCERCENVVSLHVHHIHYRTWGNEGLYDVAVLCKSCHGALHALHKDALEKITLEFLKDRTPYNPNIIEQSRWETPNDVEIRNNIECWMERKRAFFGRWLTPVALKKWRGL